MALLNFRTIEFDDHELIKRFFKQNYIDISEYTFTNLKVWNDLRNIKYALHEEGILFLATYKVHKYFLPPIGFNDPNRIFQFLLDYGREHDITAHIRRVPEKTILQLDPVCFSIEEDRDNFDYIYTRDDLVNLSGRKYSNKRAFVKKFKENYSYQVLDYDESMQQDCIDLAERWFAKKSNDKHRCDECKAIKLLLNHYDYFNVDGTVLKVDGKVAAFTFGEFLNEDTYVIHFEKAETDYIGIYQSINQLFASQKINEKYQYINREQDLGIEGIRKAKSSYLPVKMGKKYHVKKK